MNESQRSLLLQIAAELVRGEGMPSNFISDWPNIGKTTPMKTKRSIVHAAMDSRRQCHDWSSRIMRILNEKDSK